MPIEVKSSNIRSISYNPETEVLVVEYLNGSMYEYLKVPSYIYDGLVESESKGSFMNKLVKGTYEYIKIQ